MKHYKDFGKTFIGSSDIAALVLVGYKANEGMSPEKLNFGEDGSYYAYIVDCDDVEIGSHYAEVTRFESWLKIYDDDGLVLKLMAKEIIVYRAAQMGCVIRLVK